MKAVLKADNGRIVEAICDEPATIVIQTSTGNVQTVFCNVVPLEEVNDKMYAAAPALRPIGSTSAVPSATDEEEQKEEVPF